MQKGGWQVNDLFSLTNYQLLIQTMNETRGLKVGVGVLVKKGDLYLVGKRRGSHGEGEYSTPGGHLEYLESVEGCAKRETLEECGIEIGNVRFLYVSNMLEYKPKHYLNIEVLADWVSGEVKNLEPDKRESWEWCKLEEIPKPRFKALDLAIEAMKTGRNYFDF